jgi:hypothetical protein
MTLPEGVIKLPNDKVGCDTTNGYVEFLNTNYMCIHRDRGAALVALSGLASAGAQLVKFSGSGAERDVTSATFTYYFKPSAFSCLKYK